MLTSEGLAKPRKRVLAKLRELAGLEVHGENGGTFQVCSHM